MDLLLGGNMAKPVGSGLPSSNDIKFVENPVRKNELDSVFTKGVSPQSEGTHCEKPHCHRKISPAMQGLVCKCKKVFCLNHQLPEQHRCEFDWKSHGRDQLKNQSFVGKKRQYPFSGAKDDNVSY
jgi:hypothetical protein